MENTTEDITEEDFDTIQGHKQEALDKWKDKIEEMKLGVEESFLPELALVLENQSLFNEVATDLDDGEKAALIEIVAKMYSRSIARHIVSFQPMLGPASFVFYQDFEYKSKDESDKDALPEINLVLKNNPTKAKTRKLKALPDFSDTDKIATEIANEITREIVADLQRNSGTIANLDWTNAEGLVIKIMEISGVVHRKTLKGGVNWIFASEFLGKQLMKQHRIDPPVMDGADRIYKIGNLNGGWTLYIDRLFPEGTLLLGFRDREIDGNPHWKYNTGYAYCPYVPLTKTPVINDPDFCPRRGLLTRYGKKLYRSGAKYYARLTVSGIPKADVL